MQKKIKSRLAEIFFVFLCLFGSGWSVYSFWLDLNKSLTKKNEKPIATISFKYKTAQRKFIDDVMWDRLRQESPVYEGDTIRTAPLSEATIYFSDGNIMDLQENTMARISVKDGTAEVEFQGGQINVQTNNSSMKIRSGESVVELQQGAQVSAAAPIAAISEDIGSSLPGSVIPKEALQSAESAEEITYEDDGKGGVRPVRGAPARAGRMMSGGLQIQVEKGQAHLSASGGKRVNIEAGSSASLDETGTIQKTYLNVNSPAMEVKYLNLDKSEFQVPFSWESDVDDVKLEFFDSKEMQKAVKTVNLKRQGTNKIAMPAGITWWKISVKNPAGKEESRSGKVTIIQSGAPTLVAPENDFSVSYRVKTPATRFIWTECERATSYQFDISKNPDMSDPIVSQRSSQTSSIVSTLEAGTYYWRVVPYFSINGIGLAAPSDVLKFTILKSGKLEKTQLQIPAENAIVSTKVPLKNGNVAYKNINFSWKDNPEATSYKIKCWPEGKSGSAMSFDTINNYYELDTQKVTVSNGKWIWKVTTVDIEGNESTSDERSFYAMDSEVELRTVFPPDNYKLADSRVMDTRFIWKTNLPFESEFQISSDDRFRNIVYTEKTSATSLNGRSLDVGKYYWRIITDVGGSKIETKAKSFVVEPPLEAPAIVTPVNGGRTIVRPATPVEFKWNPVSGADYYQIKIFESANPDKVVYDQNFIDTKEGRNIVHRIDMDDFEERNYSWTVQAFSEETTTSSRKSGYLTSNSFNMKKLTPIKLVYPAEGKYFDGVNVIKNPDTFKWNSIYDGDEVTVVIYKNSVAERNIVGNYKLSGLTRRMPALYEGKYYWTVKGYTREDNLDVSAVENRSFTVGPIPKLAAAQNLSPASGKVYDKEYFRNTKQIDFSWSAVPQANYYIWTLYDSKGNPIKDKSVKINGTSYVMEDLSVLKKGKFYWSVEAISEYKGTLFQHGDFKKQEIVIDLPELNKLQVNNKGKRYGK